MVSDVSKVPENVREANELTHRCSATYSVCTDHPNYNAIQLVGDDQLVLTILITSPSSSSYSSPTSRFVFALTAWR